MKIVFWGASRGCGTTSNMAAVAGYLAVSLNQRVVCLQPKTGDGDMEALFRPWDRRNVLREESAYYALEGMDYLIWQEQHHRLDAAALKESMVPLLDHRLYYLSGGSREKTRLYPEQTKELQRRILARIEEYAQMVFIDMGSGQDEFTSNMLRWADVAVVNFSGDREELKRFFSAQFPCRGTVLYLMANDRFDQVYNCDNLQRIYRVDRQRLCSIPANPQFAQACARGRVESYMKACCRGRGGSVRGEQFIAGLRRAANLILEACGDD